MCVCVCVEWGVRGVSHEECMKFILYNTVDFIVVGRKRSNLRRNIARFGGGSRLNVDVFLNKGQTIEGSHVRTRPPTRLCALTHTRQNSSPNSYSSALDTFTCQNATVVNLKTV